MSQITFEEALATLQAMFAQADVSVLTAVLEQNQGHMERTIDMLLQMNIPQSEGGNQPGVFIQSGGNVIHVSPQPQSQPKTPRSGALSPKTPRGGKKKGFNQGVPDEFLRPPSYFKRQLQEQQEQQQQEDLDEDAQLAKLLQDQMFMEQLRRNPDFYLGAAPAQQQHQLLPQPSNLRPQQAGADAEDSVSRGLGHEAEADDDDDQKAPGQDGAGAAAPAAAVAPAAASGSQDDQEHHHKLAKMGEAARAKLRRIANAFYRHKDKDAEKPIPKPANAYIDLPSIDDFDGDANK